MSLNTSNQWVNVVWSVYHWFRHHPMALHLSNCVFVCINFNNLPSEWLDKLYRFIILLNNSHLGFFVCWIKLLQRLLEITTQQFRASMFYKVVHWQKLVEDEIQYILRNYMVLAISVLKIIKVSWNLTKLWQKQFWLFSFLRHGVYRPYN